MLRKFNVWWTIITGVGSGMRLGRQVDQLFRYYVLTVLEEEGLFKYLQEPRTYGQILAEFGFVDGEYTQLLFEILVNDKEPIIVKQNGQYIRAPQQQLPQLNQLVSETDKRIHGFTLMAKGMTRYIPARLRREPIELSETFELDGRQLLSKFDRTLGSRIYSTIRDGAFSMLTHEERHWLQGKKLLDVGCGSGREPAEIWLKFGGDIHITAIDSVPGLIELGEKNFSVLLDELEPGHPKLVPDNTPIFKEASVTRLPFDDNSFDAVFHSLVLHWTPDPHQAIREIVRVLKPNGLVFGSQGAKPHLNPYFDVVIQVNENSYGFFWREEFMRWYSEQGVLLEVMTPVGLFRGYKPEKSSFPI